MPHIRFLPADTSIEVDEQTKILVAGRKAQVPIRFGCASCRCGTCAVAIPEGASKLSPPKPEEHKLLKKLKLPEDGSVRLACQARVLGACTVDLDFQDSYNPDAISILDEDE